MPRASVWSGRPAGHPDLVRPGWVIAVPRASVRSRYAAGTPTQGSGHVSTAPGDDRREVRAHGRSVVEGSFAKAHDGPSSGEQGTISALVRGQLCIGGVEQQPVGLEGETQFWGGDARRATGRPAASGTVTWRFTSPAYTDRTSASSRSSSCDSRSAVHRDVVRLSSCSPARPCKPIAARSTSTAELTPRRTALSSAASSSLAPTTCARSTIVRSAGVQRSSRPVRQRAGRCACGRPSRLTGSAAAPPRAQSPTLRRRSGHECPSSAPRWRD